MATGMMWGKRCSLFVLSWLVALVSVAWEGVARPVPEEALATSQMDRRVEYIKVFLHQVQWPALARQEYFYLEVIGYDPDLLTQLRQGLADEQVDGKRVRISNTLDWSNRTQLLRPNIAYVVRSSQRYYSAVAEFFKSSPVLLVQEGMAVDENWMVCFTRASDRGDLSGSQDWVYVYNQAAIQAVFAGRKSPARRARALAGRGRAAVASGERVVTLAEGKALREVERQAAIIADQRITIDRQRDTIDSLSLRLEGLLVDSLARAWRASTGTLSRWAGHRLEFPRPIASMDGVSPEVSDWYRGGDEEGATGGALRPERPLLLQMGMLVSFAILLLLSFIPYVYGSVSIALHARPRELHSHELGAGGGAEDGGDAPVALANAAMASTISHELLTPLNAIVGFSQLAEARVGSGATSAELEQVGRSVVELRRRMESMVSAMVLAGGVSGAKRSRLELSAFLSDKCEEYRRLSMEDRQLSTVRLALRVDSCLPLSWDLPREHLSVLLDVLYKALALRAPGGEVVLGAGLPSCGTGVRLFVFGQGLQLSSDESNALRLIVESESSVALPALPSGSLVEVLQLALRFTARLGGRLKLSCPESCAVHVQLVFPQASALA